MLNYHKEYNVKPERKINNIIHDAKKRGCINLDNIPEIKEIITKLVYKPCFYCGYIENGKIIGIDRLNSNKNYIDGNMVPCCVLCNFMKNTMDIATFISHTRKIVKNNFDNTLELFEFGSDNYRLNKNKPVYSNYITGATNRNLDFDITQRQFDILINNHCVYCNFKGVIGIDRVDNSVGYTLDNVVSCCKVCNTMKNKHDKSVFLTQCNLINENVNSNLITMCMETSDYNGVRSSRKNKKDHTRVFLKCERCIVMKSGFCSTEHSNLFYSQRTKE